METFAQFRVGRERLVGMLHLPDAARPATGFPCVVFLHGLGGNRSEDGNLFTLAARLFAAHGLAALRFDFRGSGDSEGDHAEVTVSREVEDAGAAVEYARSLPDLDPERVMLLGYSVGGLVAALCAQHLRPHRLALWAPALPQDLLRFLPFGILPPTLIEYKGLAVSRNFVAELSRLRPLDAIARAGRVTHVYRGAKDDVVSRDSAVAYAEAAGAPFSEVPLVGHTFEKIGAREALFEGTLAFLSGR